jgi:hypothetical protein
MKITIEVSEKNEATSAPYWLILNPWQNMACDVFNLSGQITGPFFSREEAEEQLGKTRYNYSERAVVFCLSGCHSGQYFDECKKVGLT